MLGRQESMHPQVQRLSVPPVGLEPQAAPPVGIATGHGSVMEKCGEVFSCVQGVRSREVGLRKAMEAGVVAAPGAWARVSSGLGAFIASP